MHTEKEVEHLLIEHFPGADLLLHHVEARSFHIGLGHHYYHSWRDEKKRVCELAIIPYFH
jgi:hypothetical protein